LTIFWFFVGQTVQIARYTTKLQKNDMIHPRRPRSNAWVET
jgi:hypothetical protein